ncbi:MAG: PAS domain-containing protein [Candidatus Omnitrophica bacterium]|nr:PAS domain-containing protein [Candidatus Omnitrophota bacterium]
MEKKDTGTQQAITEALPVGPCVALAQSASEVISVLTFFTGCAVLGGWAWDVPALKSVFPGLVTMKANTAVCFILIAGALWSLQAKRVDKRFARITALSCVLPLLLISLGTFCEYAFQCNLGIDQALFQEHAGAVLTPYLGRMAFNTSINFILIGTALLFLRSGKTKFSYFLQILALAVGFIALLSLVGYCYGAPPLYIGHHFSTAMALHTTLLFLLVTLGILFCRADSGLMAHVTADLTGGMILRRFLPVAMTAPIFIGFFKIYSQKMQLFSNEFGVSLVAIANLSVMSVYIYFLSVLLNRSDLRHKTSDKIKEFMEEAVRHSDNQRRALLDNIPDLAWLKDNHGRYIAINKPFSLLCKVSTDDIAGKTDFDIWPQDQASKFINDDQDVLACGHQKVIVEPLAGKEGMSRWTETIKTPIRNDRGEMIGIVGIARDITDQKLAQEALQASKEYLSRIIDSVADPIFVKDREHRWVLFNKAFCDFMRRKPEEIMGKSDYDFFPKAEADVFWKKDEEVFLSGKENVNEESFTDAAGHTMTIVTKKALYADNNGNAQIVGIIRDMTEQKSVQGQLMKAYEELQNAQDRLVQSEKMASIGQLAAGVAHEINNPAGFVSSNLEMLENYIKKYLKMFALTDELKAALEKGARDESDAVMARIKELEKSVHFKSIVSDSETLLRESRDGMSRIEKIVSDLRTFSHEDTRWTEELVKIEDVLEIALGIAYNDFKYRIDLRKDYGNTPQVCCNAQKMGQVFLNLLVNAAQAIADKGMIRVRTYDKDGYVYIEVTDSGCGIPEENLKKIFDPFFTTKPAGKGTGLGLSISYELVKKHGGEIRVSSQPGKGTTFTVLLPLLSGKG